LAASATGARAGDPTPAEAGARYGQATSAAKICPGGVVTAKAEALAKSFTGADLETFKAEAAKVTAAWDKAFACNEIEPSGRPTQCRTIKVRSCREAWIEIGPEGRAIPGLLNLNLDNM
jgi:hypothetical protein